MRIVTLASVLCLCLLACETGSEAPEPGTATEAETGTGPETGPATETGTGTEAEAETGTATGTATATETATGPATGTEAEAAATRGGGEPAFFGVPDAPLIARLREGEVNKVEKGRGGRSLGFKLTLANGTRAYFKPEQSFSGANWYAELAAYHIDRALHLGRVPVTVARRLPWAPLRKAARGDRRLREVKVAKDGTVVGALVAWLDGALSPAQTPPGFENWVRVEPYSNYGVSPFQRPAAYTAALERRRKRLETKQPAERYYDEAPTPVRPGLPAELSDMLLLDYLTHNIDRWGGDNGNVLTLKTAADATPTLVFLDNGAGFFHGPDRQGLMEDRLSVQQCFRRSTIAALRALDVAALLKTMAADPLGPFLDESLARGLRVRREALLERVDGLIAEHGAEAVLPWP